MEAEQVVACIFHQHLGLNDSIATDERIPRPLRSAFTRSTRGEGSFDRCRQAHRLHGVMTDVLLCVSQTMGKDAFRRELSKAPLCRQY